MKSELQALLRAALDRLGQSELAGLEPPGDIPVERTRDSTHGDFASNIALALAKPARRKPREIADLIVAALPASPLVQKVEIAGPGFINFFLKAAAQFAVVGQILEQGEAYGRAPADSRESVLIEFVSANPTGPLHVGHGRGAAYGDALANLLAAAGHRVTREYYINDAGRQADVLAVSVWLRHLELSGCPAPVFPKRGYPGGYIGEIAARFRDAHGEAEPLAAGGAPLPPDPGIPADASNEAHKQLKDQQERYLDALILLCKQTLGAARYKTLQGFALESQLRQIRQSLEDFGVRFDNWISEQAIVSSGAAGRAYAKLKSAGHVYDRDGASWLRTAQMGDEKDRVLYKADQSATYFANDLAYHEDKIERGFTRLINVWGADHHGYVARVRAAIEALTGHKDVLQVQLIQFVTLSSGRMGKRSGNFVTFDELLHETGRDATRFFYLLRSQDQHLEFDIELARAHTNDNPVFYVQYAHARICRVFEQMAEKGWRFEQSAAELTRLGESHEQALLKLLARYPETVALAAGQYAPHAIVHYLRELADAFHSYYNAHTFLVEDTGLRNARLGLCRAVQQVLRNALSLVGVSAPERM